MVGCAALRPDQIGTSYLIGTDAEATKMPLKQQLATVTDRLRMKTKTELEQKGILDLTPSEC